MSYIKDAAKAKLRFPYVNGQRNVAEFVELDLSSEQLAEYGLPLQKKVSEFSNEGFFKRTRITKEQQRTQLMLNVVKELYEDKVKEEDESALATQKKAELQKKLAWVSEANEADEKAKVLAMTPEQRTAYLEGLK
jgi:hypothetical protein